jgi:hypothetical protein
MEMAVKPGSVLISLTSNSPLGCRKKSTRASPLHSSAWNAAMASRCASWLTAAASAAGICSIAPCSLTYFASYE